MGTDNHGGTGEHCHDGDDEEDVENVMEKTQLSWTHIHARAELTK